MLSLFSLLKQIVILEAAGGFVNLLDSNKIGEYLVKQYPKKLTDEDASTIQSKFNELISIAEQEGIQFRALTSNNEKDKFIKIPYQMIDIILNEFPEKTAGEKGFCQAMAEKNDKKIYIYYKNSKLAETGSGNYGSKSLDKEIHENLTAIYYNTDESYWDILDNRVRELYGYANLDVWIPSFHEQIKAIKHTYKGDFRAVRIDNEANINAVYNEVLSGMKLNWDGKLSSDDAEINKIYNNLSNMQKKWIVSSNNATKLRREAYDKSDIVLYKKNSIPKIQSKIGTIKDIEDCIDVKANMVELFNDKYLIGISLKGLSKPTGKFEMVEFNTEESAKNGVIQELKKYSVVDILRQKKNKYNIQNGFNIDIVTKDNKKLQLVLRSFGSSAALEVKFASKPPLGKSPVFLWRKFVEDNKNKSSIIPSNVTNVRQLKENFTGVQYNVLADKFGWEKINDNITFEFESTNISTLVGLQFLASLCELNDQEILDNLSTWVKAAIAEADYAFPFVLTEEI